MSEDSIHSLQEAVRALPENLALRRQLARALELAARPDEALDELQEILRRAPDDAAALLASARALYEVGRHADALERYDRAVALDVALADAALRDRIVRAQVDPRARIRLVADGNPPATPQSTVSASADAEPPAVTFADVGGLDELKEKIRLRILYPLKKPELYKAFGKKIGGGLLFYGPPGCGKTFLARATAGEAGIHFVAVGIEEVLDMWLGNSEKRLHELFRTARAQAPAILFFDEVDALGGRRSGLRHESYRTLVTQFLSELDGAGSYGETRRGGSGAAGPNGGLLVIGATNAPWDIDPAFRRPGRFAEVLFVPPPDLRARVEILKLKLVGRPTREIDVTEVARATERYSGADLDHLVESALEVALAESIKTGQVRPIVTADLLGAAARLRPTTTEWFAAAKNFTTYANETGQYDEVVDYLRRHKL